MLLGVLFVLGAALFGTTHALSAYHLSEMKYLESTIFPTLSAKSWELVNIEITPMENSGLFQSTPPAEAAQESQNQNSLAGNLTNQHAIATATPRQQPEAEDPTAEAPSQPVQDDLSDTDIPSTESSENNEDEAEVDATTTAEQNPDLQMTPTASSTPGGESGSREEQPTQPIGPAENELTPEIIPTETPEPIPPDLPVVRLEIPVLDVERRVIEVGLAVDANGEEQWNTDILFANQNRQDLVGHLEGSAYPGQSGNIVLAGHNYDWGIYQWKGVFVNIKKLSPGDEILLYTEGGQLMVYIVQEVQVLPFTLGSNNELSKHFQYLGPRPTERLTLVTCG